VGVRYSLILIRSQSNHGSVLMSFSFKPKSRSRTNLIEQANANSVNRRLQAVKTIEEKREIIKEASPLQYLFGEVLDVWKGYENYQTNMRKQFIGGEKDINRDNKGE